MRVANCSRSVGLLFAAVLAAACAAQPQSVARADVKAFVEGCSDPEAAPEQAIRLCTLALKTNELGPIGEAQTFYTRGNAFLEQGETRLALRDYDSANKRDDSMFLVWEARGRALFRLGRVPEAYQSFDKALQLNPDDRQARVGRGASAAALGRPEEALQDLDAAIAEAPDDPTAHFHRAMAFIALENPPQAVSALGEVIALSPRYGKAYHLRGQLREGDLPAEAMADYDTAINLEPENGSYYYSRGLLRDAQGDKASADDDFRRAWELGVRNEQLNKRMLEIGG